MKGGKLGFGWVVFIVVAVIACSALVVWAAQVITTYGVYDNDVNATLRTQETGRDTLKGVAAGTTGTIDVHAYSQYATFLRVHEHDADTGCVLVEAQVSADASNWVTAHTCTARTTDSTMYELEWTLPPAIYFRVIWTGMQNTVDSTVVDYVYHIFQQ